MPHTELVRGLPRSKIIKARLAMFGLSGLLRDVCDAIDSENLFDDTILAALECRCRDSHAEYLQRLDEYKLHCISTSLKAPSSTELVLRRETFGAICECLIIVKRMLATVCDKDRSQLELEVQSLARILLDLHSQHGCQHSWLFGTHGNWVAHTASETQAIYDERNDHESLHEARLATRNRFSEWTKLLWMAARR